MVIKKKKTFLHTSLVESSYEPEWSRTQETEWTHHADRAGVALFYPCFMVFLRGVIVRLIFNFKIYLLSVLDLFTSEVHSNKGSRIDKDEEGLFHSTEWYLDWLAEIPVGCKPGYKMSFIWVKVRRKTTGYQGRG